MNLIKLETMEKIKNTLQHAKMYEIYNQELYIYFIFWGSFLFFIFILISLPLYFKKYYPIVENDVSTQNRIQNIVENIQQDKLASNKFFKHFV